MEKIGQKVYEININKVVGAKSDLYKNGVTITEYKIIGISAHKICINSPFFMSFDYVKEGGRKNRSYSTYLDDISINVKTKETYFGNGIFIKLYSTKKPNKKLLEKMLNKGAEKVKKDYGFLFDNFENELKNNIENYRF